MVGFFPTPYPNECLYSLLCRYFVRNGITSYAIGVTELFGKPISIAPTVHFPLRIECTSDWFSPKSGIDRENIAANHTLHPYWAIMYSPDFREKVDNAIYHNESASGIRWLSFFRNRHQMKTKYLKYCPTCATEDVDTFGEPYWHREHQLSEMLYCTKHRIRLIDSPALIKDTSHKIYPASSVVNLKYGANTFDNFEVHKEKFLKVGQECEWLIAHGLDIDWSVNGHGKYWRLLRDKGFATFKGKCTNHIALNTEFYNYWGKDFIDILFDVVLDSQFRGWTHRIGGSFIERFSSLQHILLMCFLSGSVENFIKADPADTAFGKPPFDCENLICPHYHVDGAEMVGLVDYGQGKAAYFECIHCGMRYKYTKSSQARGIKLILDYGRLWRDELIRCCQDSKITREQAMEILKCSRGVLEAQKKKYGLMKPLLHDMEIGPEKYYKSKVTELCQECDEVTIELLCEKVPGAYAYLLRHESEWLKNRLTYKKGGMHRFQREEYLMTQINELMTRFEREGYPKHQISYAYLASLIDSSRDELRRMVHLQSEVGAVLENILESRANWRQERSERLNKNKAHKGD